MPGQLGPRAEIAEVALPLLFNSLDGLAIDETRETRVGGWVFRGMLNLPVTWSKASATPNYGVAVSGEPPRREMPHPPRAQDRKLRSSVPDRPAASARRRFCARCPGPPPTLSTSSRVPYGLLRTASPPTTRATKSVAAQFDRLFADTRARFIGNTDLGSDVTMDELKANYDAVVLASGLNHDRLLDIPGTKLNHVYRAGTITRLLNGHPDEAETGASEVAPMVLGSRVAVVGQGNVAIDILRLLTCRSETLEGSDIDDLIHGSLRSDIARIDIIGRSEPSAREVRPRHDP